MRILLSTFGSRGDVEPMVAIAATLQAQGAEAFVSAPPDQEFTDLLARADVPFAAAFYSIRQWIADKAKPSAPTDFQKLAAEVMAGQYEAINAAAEGCDVIVATGLFPSCAAAQAVAEKRGIRHVHAAPIARSTWPPPTTPQPSGPSARSRRASPTTAPCGITTPKRSTLSSVERSTPSARPSTCRVSPTREIT